MTWVFAIASMATEELQSVFWGGAKQISQRDG